MKKIILIICIIAFGVSNSQAQTRVIVRRPAHPMIAPASRTVIVSRPVRRVRPTVVVRPAVTVVRPAVRRGVIVVHR